MPGQRRNRVGSGRSGNTSKASAPLESPGGISGGANQGGVDVDATHKDPGTMAAGDPQEAAPDQEASATNGSKQSLFCPELAATTETGSSRSLPGGSGQCVIPKEVGHKLEELRIVLLEGADYRPIELLDDILKMLEQQPVVSADGLIDQTSPGEKTMRRWMARPTKVDASTQVHTLPGDEEAFEMSDVLSIGEDSEYSSDDGGVFLAESLLDDDGAIVDGKMGLFGGFGGSGSGAKGVSTPGSGHGEGESHGATTEGEMGDASAASAASSKPSFKVPKLPLHTLGVQVPKSPQQPPPSPSSRQSTVPMSPRPPPSPGVPVKTPRSSSLHASAMQRKTPRGGNSPSSGFWKTSQAAEERINALEEQLEIQKQLSARGSTNNSSSSSSNTNNNSSSNNNNNSSSNNSALSRRLEVEFESEKQQCGGSIAPKESARRIELNGVDEEEVSDLDNTTTAVNGTGDKGSGQGMRLHTWEDIAGIRGGDVVDWGEIPLSGQSNKRLFMF